MPFLVGWPTSAARVPSREGLSCRPFGSTPFTFHTTPGVGFPRATRALYFVPTRARGSHPVDSDSGGGAVTAVGVLGGSTTVSVTVASMVAGAVLVESEMR